MKVTVPMHRLRYIIHTGKPQWSAKYSKLRESMEISGYIMDVKDQQQTGLAAADKKV